MTAPASPTADAPAAEAAAAVVPIAVNDIVYISDDKDGLEGVVQYVDDSGNAPKRIGVLLVGKSARKGNSDGYDESAKNRYFTCPPNAAIFVDADRVTKRTTPLNRLEELRLRRELVAMARATNSAKLSSFNDNNSIVSEGEASTESRMKERKDRIEELRQQRLARKKQQLLGDTGISFTSIGLYHKYDDDAMSTGSSVSSITSYRSDNFQMRKRKSGNQNKSNRSNNNKEMMKVLHKRVLELEDNTSKIEKKYLDAMDIIKEREEEISRLRISLLDCKHDNYNLKRQNVELEEALQAAAMNNQNMMEDDGNAEYDEASNLMKSRMRDGNAANNSLLKKKRAKEFLDEVQGLFHCRTALDEGYRKVDPQLILSNKKVEVSSSSKDDKKKNQKQDGSSNEIPPGETSPPWDNLYYTAQKTLPVFERFVGDMVDRVDGITSDMIEIMPLKEKESATKKFVEYNAYNNNNSSTSIITKKKKTDEEKKMESNVTTKIYDIVRGSITCETTQQLLDCVDWLEQNTVIRQVKNRFQNPCYNGYRDFLFHVQMNVKLPIRVTSDNNNKKKSNDGASSSQSSFNTICELQIHLGDIRRLSKELNSYRYYKYFRKYFRVGLSSVDISHRKRKSSPSTMIAVEKARRLKALQYIDENQGQFDQESFIDGLMMSSINMYAATSTDSSQSSIISDGDLEDGDDDEHLRRLCLQTIAELFYQNLSEHDVAMQLYVRELRRLEEKTIEGSNADSSKEEQKQIHIAWVHNHMANIFYDRGQMEDSMLSHEMSLAIREKILGNVHPDVAQTYYQMARVLWRQWKLDEALIIYKKALDIRLEILEGNENNNDVADIYYNMAIILDDQEKLKEAMELYQKVLSIWNDIFESTATGKDEEETEGEDENSNADSATAASKAAADEERNQQSHQVAALYNNMANVLRRQGNLKEEMKYYEMALKLWRTVSPDEDDHDHHSKVADTYNNMACVLDEQGDLTQAMELYRKAISIWKRVLGEQHSKVADIHYNISIVYEKKGQYTEAAFECSKARDIYEKNYGKNHNETLDAQQEVMRLKALIVPTTLAEEEESDST